MSFSNSRWRRLARRLGYRWKRLRRRLKARCAAVFFPFFQQELALLHRQERAGEVAVGYLDECRVSRQAPVPHAWQVRGQPAVGLPAERGTGGYAVLGFWQPGAADPARAVVGLLSETAWTADLFVKAVDDDVATLDRPTVLVPDNASIHRATCVQQPLRAWRTAGLANCGLAGAISACVLPRTQPPRNPLAFPQALRARPSRLCRPRYFASTTPIHPQTRGY